MGEDDDQSYVALAMALLQALRGGRRAQAAALAQQMQQRFGDCAGAAGKLLEVLNNIQEEGGKEEEDDDDEEEEEEEEEEVEESEDSVDEESTESSGSSSGEDSVEDGNVSEALRSLVEGLPSPTALPDITNIKPDTTSGEKTVEAIKEGIDEIDEGETEEERRIFASIAGTVDAEMKRLAIVRKHR